jgi:ABC-type antimicrobial peptide transport system ATPase subunit
MEVLVETKNLSKCFEKTTLFTHKEDRVSAVNNVSLQIQKEADRRANTFQEAIGFHSFTQ